MRLENSFTIGVSLETSWAALNDPVLIAPCFPGANLSKYEGDRFEGMVRVKLGPIAMKYSGSGVYTERDPSNHRVVIEASGRAVQGNSTAKATVTITLSSAGADGTTVTMVTDLAITGRPAQFGRGVIVDVADKIVGQFAECVAAKLTASDEKAPDGGDDRSAEARDGAGRPSLSVASGGADKPKLAGGTAVASSSPELDALSLAKSVIGDGTARLVRRTGGKGVWWAGGALVAIYFLIRWLAG